MDLIIHVTIFAITVIQLLYWILIFPKAKPANAGKRAGSLPVNSVAVLICAKNEGENLQRNLPKILSQNYPAYTVYVIDDGSTDYTRQVLEKISRQNPRLRRIESPPHIAAHPGKKKAIDHAIFQIEEPFLLFTDADCYPVSKQWIAEMTAPLAAGKRISIGYSPYKKYTSMLNRFIRYDTCYSAIQYLSLANWGLPYMGVGRNLAYRKSLYETGSGFHSHLDLASGDDDLFVNQHATAENSQTVVSLESMVVSEPERTWKSFINQRKRHLSSSKKYHLPHQYILTALHGTHILLYLLIPVAWILTGTAVFAIMALVIRWMIISIVFSRLSRPLACSDLRFFVPLLDGLYAFFYCALIPSLLFKKNTTWD